MSKSPAEILAEQTPEARKAFLDSLSGEQLLLLRHEWERFWARPEQLPPLGDWRIWMIRAGRGYGKTRAGAEWVRTNIDKYPIWHLVGATARDLRNVMVEGSSGVMNVFPDGQRPTYNPTNAKVTFHNGAVALLFSAEEPERLRGPQCHAFWADELGAWNNPEDTWNHLMLGFRLGSDPRGIVTTTPKPTKLIRELSKASHVRVTMGSTLDNRANLAPSFLNEIVRRYEGTRLGRQEIYAELLEDVDGALWKTLMIEETRVTEAPADLERIVVGVDPSVTGGEKADEAGIIVAGVRHEGRIEHAYVLEDFSLSGSPETWARAAVNAYRKWDADRIVAEKNQGGEMVEMTLRVVDKNIAYKAVHASKGKFTRAEPVVALYEKKQVHHVGLLQKLEEEMCTWVQGAVSPNRLDALVWTLTELMLGGGSDPLDIVVPLDIGYRESPWRI